jgi:hypothetical protein
MSGRGQHVGAAALLAAAAACAGVLFTAPPGSSITLISNPPFVASNGGVSVITAIVVEPNGTPVSDGTVVLFFTDIGTIDRQGKTKDGIARVNFVADSRSGVATIRALSGGPAPAASAAPSPAPTNPPTTPPPGGGGGGTGDATTTVTVGNVRITAIRLRADPPRITTSNSTHVFALVVDANGNPIPNVPVYFEVILDAAAPTPSPSPSPSSSPPFSPTPPPAGRGTEFFDVSGPVFTNNNGEAENVLRTRRETAGVAQVRASAPGPNGFVDSPPLGIPIL